MAALSLLLAQYIVMASPLSTAQTDVVDLIALEIFVILSTFLFAVACCQFYVYWRSNFRNSRYVWYIVCVHSHGSIVGKLTYIFLSSLL